MHRHPSPHLFVTVLALAVAGPPCLPLAARQLTPAQIRRHADAQIQNALGMYQEFLSIPNDSHHPDDMRRVIRWVSSQFASRGFSVEELPTPGSPLVLATRNAGAGARTVLVYLQSDGQPVDPSAWFQTDPYTPTLKERTASGEWRALPWARLQTEQNPEWRIFARSASDSKGPITQFLAALDALAASGTPQPFNLKVIIDTEEELGSPHLPAAVEAYRDRLDADVLVILDGPPHVSNRPTLKFGARGIVTFTLTTHGPVVPQHSGHYGNYAPNPALRLAQILASMKDETGRVTIPGFYDGVNLDAETRAILARVPDDEASIMRQLQIARSDEVAGSLQEAVQYPSLNIRGMSSGWVGAQRRTIVPATATAEVDIRLVLESDWERLIGLVRQHIERLGYLVLDREPTEDERLAHDRIATFTFEHSYGAFRTDFDSLPGRWLRGAMVNLFGEEPILIRTSGGSIPISPFVETLGVPAVSVPTVNPDNNQHSPNENIRLGNFIDGIRTLLAVFSHPIPDLTPQER
jgi:acetylornithine deacetylase/succinyl-diaminopimelate desuccinylase-like protein